MEYIIFFGAFILFLVFIFMKGAFDARKNRKNFEQKLFQDYGKLPEKEYKLERFARINSYYLNHPQEGQIDDITWNDLDMDEIFRQMNHSYSSTGEEYLYYILRTPQTDPDKLLHLEEMVQFFDENARRRVDVELLMDQLGTTGNYSLYDYLRYLGDLGKRSNMKHIAAILGIAVLIVLCFFLPSVGIVGIVSLLCYNIVTYYKEKSVIEPYIVSFAYIMRLLHVCDTLVRLPIPPCEKEWERIKKHKARLSSMRSGSFWALSGGGISSTGNPLEILIDYVKMVFHVDIIVFNRMLSELNKHLEDIDVLIGEVGYVEASICIAAYRSSIEHALGNEWCIPDFVPECRIRLEEGYHPLIQKPVKNSISTDRGVLLTGSNASGKSTFLKTMALNAILAQTIHTCLAGCYEAPFFRVLSSMALRDDLGSGESYYIVEIKSLKRILDASAGEDVPLLCFVDEVLRGTNTVERIAASTQILKSLSGRNILCFAATHDIELTELLKEEYNNYHFEEEIRDGDIFFNYKLMSGKATTRNAIKLLELMGYDEKIIQEAVGQAEHFIRTGSWN